MDLQGLRKKIKKPLKIIGYILLAWVVLVTLYASYFAINTLKDKLQKNKLEITVEYNAELCSEEFPLLVLMENGSTRTINYVDFDIEVRRKGYSNNIASYLSYDTDKIIEPNKRHVSCWRYDLKSVNEKYDDPEKLEFSISDYRRIKFEK